MMASRILEFTTKSTDWAYGTTTSVGGVSDSPPTARRIHSSQNLGTLGGSSRGNDSPALRRVTSIDAMMMRGGGGDNNKNNSNNKSNPSTEVFRPRQLSSSLARDAALSLSSTNQSYLNYGVNLLRSTADSTYTTLTSMLSSFPFVYPPVIPNPYLKPQQPTLTEDWTASNIRRRRVSAIRRLGVGDDLSWMVRNPYDSVRGRYAEPTSMSAVRSLITLVPPEDKVEAGATARSLSTSSAAEPSMTYHHGGDPDLTESSMLDMIPAREVSAGASDMSGSTHNNNNNYENLLSPVLPTVSTSETASQLAEGTIRALRDLALDEAVDLQEALRFWTYRWERPLLSWLEAGPFVWTAPGGYNHQSIGQRVSQIQAVLARRCAAIGELQQHLLRAGWQRGVAQWGVLGQGAQWAAVAGFDNRSAAQLDSPQQDEEQEADEEAFGTIGRTRGEISATPPSPRPLSVGQSANRRLSSQIPDPPPQDDIDGPCLLEPPPSLPTSRVNFQSQRRYRKGKGSNKGKVIVGKADGGGIFVDDPCFLAEWSVQAIALVRRYIYRAGNGAFTLPHASNWDEDEDLLLSSTSRGRSGAQAWSSRILPVWATEGFVPSSRRTAGITTEEERNRHVRISNLPLMVTEVEDLLDMMEHTMAIQRHRRLDRLRSPSWLRRNWYLIATATPSIGSLLLWIIRKGLVKQLMSSVLSGVGSFYRERVRDPLVAIANELLKGRESFSDKKARMEAIETLKTMIKSWLDDTYPHMPESDRMSMAEAMDVSLIEKKKEESMKTFYEINNVVRMSFIEMQYMKKEMMNALHAMDEVISANDINMNIASITPVFMLAYLFTRLFRFLNYALLRLGTSREEIYASFRNVLLDIERLLVMRDNPPRPTDNDPSGFESEPIRPFVLGPDDLGMLMLLIHECRTILWRSRRRFSETVIQSVSEDLAELAGERGAVSVQQQLLIVARMVRSYPFLKVISTGHIFQFNGLSAAG